MVCKLLLVAGTVTNQVPTFTITEIKLYVPVVTLSFQDNAKLLKQLKSGFKRKIYQNTYQSIITTQVPKKFLDYLVDPSLQGVSIFLYYHMEILDFE